MKKVLLSIFLFIIISAPGFSQSNQITIRFIGNCGLHFTDGNMNLYVDFPYQSGAHKYMTYPASEIDSIKNNSIFLFTHRHTDHYSNKLVKKLKKERQGKVYGNWNVKELAGLNDTLHRFSVQPIKTSHKFTFTHYSYLITWHGKILYISGDTGDWYQLSNIKHMDWAFLNPWLYMNAKKEKVTINAKMVGIYHLYPNQKVDGEIPPDLLILKNQQELITIPY